jgi:hypothetical protein
MMVASWVRESIGRCTRNVSFQKSQKCKKYRKHPTVNSCPIPLLVPYNKLIPFIKSINTGTVYNTSDLCTDLEEGDKVQGCYGDLKGIATGGCQKKGAP